MVRHNVRHAFVMGAGLVSMLTACGQSPNDSTSKSVNSAPGVEIVGGQDVPDTQDDARRWSTVALTTDYQKDPAAPSTLDAKGSFCSGTLIGPRLVVTASHCIQAFDPNTHQRLDELILPKDTDFIVHFDTKVSREGRWIRATKVVSHPDWDPDATLTPSPTKAPNDIGLIFLEEDAPSSARPAQIADLNTTPAEKDEIYLAGYGVTKSRNTNDTGTLRQVATTFSSADATSQRLAVGAFFRGACAGDSGGPLFFKQGDQYLLAGATSTGAELFGRCLGLINNYTDVRYYTDWIKAQQAALKP